MTYQIKIRDITSIESGVIAHQVNCQKAMGSGVALAILKKWPKVRSQYMSRGQGKEMLGTVDIVDVEHRVKVANIYGQLTYGNNGIQHTNLAALERGLRETFKFCQINGFDLYLPQIGCGLGGADWDTQIEPIVKQIHDEFNVNTTVCVWP